VGNQSLRVEVFDPRKMLIKICCGFNEHEKRICEAQVTHTGAESASIPRSLCPKVAFASVVRPSVASSSFAALLAIGARP
jgi:hypothetical protein